MYDHSMYGKTEVRAYPPNRSGRPRVQIWKHDGFNWFPAGIRWLPTPKAMTWRINHMARAITDLGESTRGGASRLSDFAEAWAK